MIKQIFFKDDGITLTEDYNEAGFFSLEKAGEVVLNHEYGFISPDASGKWLVVVIRGVE
jgi:hypothetical protein